MTKKRFRSGFLSSIPSSIISKCATIFMIMNACVERKRFACSIHAGSSLNSGVLLGISNGIVSKSCGDPDREPSYLVSRHPACLAVDSRGCWE